MKASINSTRRRRLERRHVRLAVRRNATGRPVVDASFDLAELGLPPEARIVLEAHRQSVVERIAFGTVREARPEGEAVLLELDTEKLQFRVKVVDPATGRLLARGDRLTAGGDADEGSRRELFRVRTADLGQEIWKVELGDVEPPWLVLNKNVGDPLAFLADPQVRATVLPMAMRQVLQQLWHRKEDIDQDGGEDEWTQRWFGFAERMAGDDRPGNDEREAMLDWIDRACAGFAQEFQLLDRLLASRREPT